MAGTYVGYGWYKDENGNPYQMKNGKRYYADSKLNKDDGGTLINTRGGFVVWQDENGNNYQYGSDGVSKIYLDPKLNDKNNTDTGRTKAELDAKQSGQEVQKWIEEQNKSDSEDDAQNDPADLVTENSVNISNKMKTFKNMLDKLNDKFNNNRAVYTMYYKMTMNTGQVLVDTTSKDWVENCFISFNHKMNGSGEANTFTLDLLFKPSDRSIIVINALESKLLASCAIYNSETELKEQSDLYYNCIYQYGYGDETDMRSPLYYGTIMDYDCSLENGNLHYTITGYGGLYSAKEYRISSKEEYLTDKNGATINDPISFITRIFEVEFGKNNEYAVKNVNIDKSKITYPGDDYKQFNQKNIFQVVEDILSGCMTTDQYNAMSGTTSDDNPDGEQKTFLPNQKQMFGYYIDNTQTEGGGKYGTVYVYKMESLYGEENKDKTVETIEPDCGISFGWFAPSTGSYNHIVKDWKPKFEGSPLMALATTYRSGGDTYYTMTDSGNIEPVVSLSAARQGISDSNANKMILSTIQEYNNWTFVTQYPYSASMTLIGVPCEVPMTGKIRVIAKMGTQNHHSSGVYMILGKTDKINSSGFFSEFELYKFAPGYDPNYQSINSDKKDYELGNSEYDPSVPGTRANKYHDRIYIKRVSYKDNDNFGYILTNENALVKRLAGDNRVYGHFIYDYTEGKSKKLGYITNDGEIVIYGGSN